MTLFKAKLSLTMSFFTVVFVSVSLKIMYSFLQLRTEPRQPNICFLFFVVAKGFLFLSPPNYLHTPFHLSLAFVWVGRGSRQRIKKMFSTNYDMCNNYVACITQKSVGEVERLCLKIMFFLFNKNETMTEKGRRNGIILK